MKKRVVVSFVLVLVVVWGVRWAWLERGMAVHRSLGIQAWFENRPEVARGYFKQALSINPLLVGVWLDLADVEIALGKADQARQIVLFTDRLAGDVVKWKWEQVLMARQLGMEKLFWRNVNFAIQVRPLRDQALELVDMEYGRDVQKVLAGLDDDNQVDYLDWLMARGRVKDTVAVWAVVGGNPDVDGLLHKRYTDFLFRHKKIQEATAIWQQYTGRSESIFNSGFEQPLSGDVFGWRHRSGNGFDVRRDRTEVREGGYALQVTFDGHENVRFYHLRQYVPVAPGRTYGLSFWWQGQRLTTDERPYWEIRGVNGQSHVWKSDMAKPDFGWQQEHIGFTAGPDCHAMMIRLRRSKSHRFDNKIKGRLWLDKFEMTPITNHPSPITSNQ